MKMGRRPRCSSVTYRSRYAPLLAPCRRRILIATKAMLFRGQDTSCDTYRALAMFMAAATLSEIFLEVAVGSMEHSEQATRSAPGRCAYFPRMGSRPTRPTSSSLGVAGLKISPRLGRKSNPGKRSLTPVAGGASQAGRGAHPVTITFPAKFAGFHIDNLSIKIPLALRFVEYTALTLLPSVG
jgi:hypothetical protein